MALNETSLTSQITESGIQYSVEYLGSVPIESSILEMTTDLRILVIHESIYMLAKEHQLIEPQFQRDLNRVAQKVIGNGEIKVRKGNLAAELNIQAKQLRIVSNGAMIGRHCINNVSFASKGQFGNFFGYVAKKADGSDRRCYVMSFPDTNVVMRSINEAMRLYMESEMMKRQQEITPRALPTAPISPFLSNQPTSSPDSANSSSVNTPTNPVFDMYGEPWYHGVISREAAERLLKEDGDFLIRQSINSPGQVILSSRDNGEHKHMYLIENGKVRTIAREFPSVKALINYHVQTGAMITSNESKICLIRPIPKNL